VGGFNFGCKLFIMHFFLKDGILSNDVIMFQKIDTESCEIYELYEYSLRNLIFYVKYYFLVLVRNMEFSGVDKNTKYSVDWLH